MAGNVRIVVDTNVLVSALIGRGMAGFTELLVDERVVLFTGKDQVAELLDVVERDKFRTYFSLKEARAAVADFCILASFVNDELPLVTACRDPKDNYLLALAKASKARFPITGDKDLLVLGSFGAAEIITPTAFKQRM